MLDMASNLTSEKHEAPIATLHLFGRQLSGSVPAVKSTADSAVRRPSVQYYWVWFHHHLVLANTRLAKHVRSGSRRMLQLANYASNAAWRLLPISWTASTWVNLDTISCKRALRTNLEQHLVVSLLVSLGLYMMDGNNPVLCGAADFLDLCFCLSIRVCGRHQASHDSPPPDMKRPRQPVKSQVQPKSHDRS